MTGNKASDIAAAERRLRQEELLKANLKRRKEQARARRLPATEMAERDGADEAKGEDEA